MDTITNIQTNIKQEPVETEFEYEDFDKSLNMQSHYLSTSNDVGTSGNIYRPLMTSSSHKRKDIEKILLGAKRRKMFSELNNDIEVLSDDYKFRHASNSNDTQSKSDDVLLSKFQCLLCDDSFDTDNELTAHLAVIHNHVTIPKGKQQSRFARHTCQVCFAKFRTLKDFFNHTSCHAVQPGMNAIDREMSTRVSNNISKNALQHYFLNATTNFSRDLIQPSFRCDCCNTLFVNRDSYAMHVMMRVKNEACKQNGVTASTQNTEAIGREGNQGDIDIQKSPVSTNISFPENGGRKSEVCTPESLQQAYYVDVTSSTEKDEYLLSVLGKVSGQNNNNDKINSNAFVANALKNALKEGRKCSVCSEVFTDQDSLAMHVMSKHSNDVSPTPSSHSSAGHHNKTPSPTSPRMMKYFSPFTSDRLLTLQAEVLFCDYCGQSFVNRDTLAMHVLTHTRDQEMTSASRASSVSDYMCLARMHDTAQLANLRRLSESHRKSVLINSEEPLNLVSEKTSSNKQGIHEENETTVLKTQTNINELQSKLSDTEANNVYPELPPLERIINPVLENKYDNSTFCVTRTEDTLNAPNSFIPRSASVPTIYPDVPVTERAASTGCMPSNDYLKDLATRSILPTEKYQQTSTKVTVNTDQIQSTDSYVNKQVSTIPTYTPPEQCLVDLLGNQGGTGSGTNNSEKSSRGDICPVLVTPTGEKERSHMEVLLKEKDVHMCKFCEIIFPTRTLYYLHMGLHNHNTPWQCNLCGKLCTNVHDFNAHVIHL